MMRWACTHYKGAHLDVELEEVGRLPGRRRAQRAPARARGVVRLVQRREEVLEELDGVLLARA